MSRKIEFTDNERKALVQQYRAGASIRELVMLCGHSYGTIRATLLVAGVKLRAQGGTRRRT